MNFLVKISAVEAQQYSADWDPYLILGIRRRATVEQIRAAYRREAKSVHSDAGGDPAAFLLLKEAHDFLMDPVARSLWNRKQIRATEIEGKKARKLLDQICGAVITKIATGNQLPPEHANIPELMRQVICAQLDEFAQNQNEVRKKLGRLKLMTGKVRRKGKGENIIARTLDTRIVEAEAALSALAEELRVADIMLAELEVYEFDAPPEPIWSQDPFASATPRGFTIKTFF